MAYGNIFYMKEKMFEVNQKFLDLGSIEKTLIIPLWARAYETINNGLINDELSVKLLNQLDTAVFGFDQMGKFIKNYLLTAIANRTILIDQFLSDSLTNDSIVLNFGCGLDTRYSRFKSKVKMWYDIDMSDVIELRKYLIEEEDNYKMISKSILDNNLFDNIQLNGKTVIICEGILMYFKEYVVKDFVSKLIANTKSGHLIIESLGNWAKIKVNPVIKGIGENSRYIWTINDPTQINLLNNKLSVVESTSIFEINQNRWGLYGKLMGLEYFNKRISGKITHYRY